MAPLTTGLAIAGPLLACLALALVVHAHQDGVAGPMQALRVLTRPPSLGVAHLLAAPAGAGAFLASSWAAALCIGILGVAALLAWWWLVDRRRLMQVVAEERNLRETAQKEAEKEQGRVAELKQEVDGLRAETERQRAQREEAERQVVARDNRIAQLEARAAQEMRQLEVDMEIQRLAIKLRQIMKVPKAQQDALERQRTATALAQATNQLVDEFEAAMKIAGQNTHTKS